MQRFSPTLQLRVAAHVEHAHMGPIPTLAQVSRCYGEPTAEAVLCFELEDLNRFAGTKTKLEMHQQKEVARIILTEFYYLKVSEVLLFFFRLKSGRYGSFYGSVDAIQILVFLRTFTGERLVALERYEAESRRLRQEEERKKTSSDSVTYEQYLEIKKRKEKLKEPIKQD